MTQNDDQDRAETSQEREDIMAGDRRLSRADASLPDWEVPDTAYRPIPIVWFAGAFIVQLIVLFAIFVLSSSISGYVTIALAAFASGMIGAWTWMRGMQHAAGGWRIATILVLLAQFGLVASAAAIRL